MERAVVVNVFLKDAPYRDSWPTEEAAQELQELVASSGVEVLEMVRVQRGRPTPDYFIGTGKVDEIHTLCHELKPDAVVFGESLNFPQQRNLEDRIGVKVIDRTQLILDIFAQRAHSREGKVQVELAQLEYLLPRLAGKGILLSRLGGGIGTRGPGEQKLEIDRRRIRLRIGRLQKELQEVHCRREVARNKRKEEEIPSLALIGYTNAGKSTLLNTLTQAQATSEDRLFTTLDPLARRLTLPNRQPVLVTDTVGFLHHLPHTLIEAFKATLEEVTESELLLHVLDLSSSLVEEKSAAVHEVLETLGAAHKPVLTVFNKIDMASPETLQAFTRKQPEGLQVSAKTGQGIGTLLDRLTVVLGYLSREAVVLIPAEEQAWVERIYNQGQVLSRHQRDGNTQIRCRVPHRLYGQMEKAGLLDTPSTS